MQEEPDLNYRPASIRRPETKETKATERSASKKDTKKDKFKMKEVACDDEDMCDHKIE